MTIKAEDFGKVAVLMGGDSSEREISLQSGRCVLEALCTKNINAYGVDVGRDIVQQLSNKRPDRVFNALHGKGGEDGVMQSLLDLLKIPYTGSQAAAAALTFDKEYSTSFWQELNIPVIPFLIMQQNNTVEEILEEFPLMPLCVKPIGNGSSCGISKVMQKTQLFPAYELALKYDATVMVQPWIEGREFTVGIVGNQALPVVEIVTPLEFYNYQAKYFTDTTKYICPAELTLKEQQKIQQIALKAFQTAGCRHWGRADFIQDKEGKFWLLEINTVPGLTTHSLVPKAAKQMGWDFADLIWKILEFTL